MVFCVSEKMWFAPLYCYVSLDSNIANVFFFFFTRMRAHSWRKVGAADPAVLTG